RSIPRIDRRSIEKVWKQMDRIVKYCQMPKMNLKNSPPYMLDILPDLYQTLREIINNYDDRLHILNDIDYFRIFLDIESFGTRFPFILIFIGRGGIGGGVKDIVSDEILAPFVYENIKNVY
ncbi:unnamed protein product, partial [Adineta steineri]